MFLYTVVDIVNVFLCFSHVSRHLEGPLWDWMENAVFLRFCFSFSKHYMANTTTLPYQVSPVDPIPKLFPKYLTYLKTFIYN